MYVHSAPLGFSVVSSAECARRGMRRVAAESPIIAHFWCCETWVILFVEDSTYGNEKRVVLMVTSHSTVSCTGPVKIVVTVLGRSRFVYILAECPPYCQFKLPRNLKLQVQT